MTHSNFDLFYCIRFWPWDVEWENLEDMKDQEFVQQEMHNYNLSPPDTSLLAERRAIQKVSLPCHQQRVFSF